MWWIYITLSVDGSGNESTDSEDRHMSHPYVVVYRGGCMTVFGMFC